MTNPQESLNALREAQQDLLDAFLKISEIISQMSETVFVQSHIGIEAALDKATKKGRGE